MKAYLTGFMILCSAMLCGQETFTLSDCHRLAMENAPRLGDQELIRQIGALKVDQAGKKLVSFSESQWKNELSVRCGDRGTDRSYHSGGFSGSSHTISMD